MDLGEHFLCLNVADLAASIEFYARLGFRVVDDHRDENWATIRHGRFAVCLFQGHIDRNLMNFRGGDVEAICREAEAGGVSFAKPAHREADGSWAAEAVDPDGNHIYFNTFPDERERYQQSGGLIE